MTDTQLNYHNFCLSLREIINNRDVTVENEQTLDFLGAITICISTPALQFDQQWR
ncbi:hypothetical protein ACVIKP_007045 [Rhizobium leguminosarum]